MVSKVSLKSQESESPVSALQQPLQCCGMGAVAGYSGPGDQERRGEGGKLRPNYGDCSNPVLIVKVHHFLLTLGIFDLCSEDCEISNNLACNYSDSDECI